MGSFLTGAMNALSKHIVSAADTERKRRQYEDEDEKAVFESLIKSPDPRLKEIGLAGLIDKPKRGWLGRRITPKARDQVRQYLETAQAQQEALTLPEPAPPPSMPAPSAPASATQPTTSPTQGGAMTLTPGVGTAPPERPTWSRGDVAITDPSMIGSTSALGNEMTPVDLPEEPVSPTAAGTPPPSMSDLSSKWEKRRGERRQKWERENALDLSGSADYKADPIQEALDYAEVFGIPRDQALEIVRSKIDPLGAKAANTMEAKTFDWTQRGLAQDKRAQADLQKYEVQNTVPIDATAASEFGLPEGLRMDKTAFKELSSLRRSSMSIAQRREAAQAILNRPSFAFLYNEATGNTVAVDRRTAQIGSELAGVRPTAPSFGERKEQTIDTNLVGDVEKLKALTLGRDDLIGWFDSLKQKALSMGGAADPAWLEAKYLAQNALVNKLKAMSGSAVSPSEATRLLALIPDIDGLMSNEQKFRTDLAMFERELKQSMDKYRMERKGAPPNRPGTGTKRRTASGVEYTVEE